MGELNWDDAQWQKVNEAVTEAFNQASVAGGFLPMYGPLVGSAEVVRNERLHVQEESGITTVRNTVILDKDHRSVNLKLLNMTVNVELSSEQVADEKMSNALLAFRRAANILALAQDRVVFSGHQRGLNPDENAKIIVNTVSPQKGLADLFARHEFANLSRTPKEQVGRLVVTAVVNAMSALEDRSHPAPFACVLGNTLYEAVHDPSASLVLPADRVTPLLRGGPLLRSGGIDPETGIMVSLAGKAVDVVVGTPPTAQFLQRTADAKFLFRVYVRFTLRIRDKERPPVAGFRLEPAPGRYEEETNRINILTQASS
jgi:uncharacterized linocin/CFP29 family protein